MTIAPAPVAAPFALRPQPGPQETFLSTTADVAIYGGAAGGGKSYALLMEPLYHIGVRGFNAVCFRQTFPQITLPGGLWPTSQELYPLTGGVANKSTLSWTWPSGAMLRFAHLGSDDELTTNWHGAQIALILWDELTNHTERQFWYLFSRNRSTCGVRPYVRATCNPDPDSFVAELIAWWIDQDTGYPIPERAGVLRYFVREGDELRWVPRGTRDAAGLPAKSLTFIPARVTDNRLLLAKDPGYLSNLLAQPTVERERLLKGNWKVRHAAGKVFSRYAFPVVDAAPAGGQICRFWDFAATEQSMKRSDPDYTAAVKLLRHEGRYYVLDVIAERIGPSRLDAFVVAVTQQDLAEAQETGARYMVRWETEPGSAAKRETNRLVTLLAGVDGGGVAPQGDKVTRARALAAQVEAGNVLVVRGPWNERFLTELHSFPDGAHDDVVDGTSGAFNALLRGGGSLIR